MNQTTLFEPFGRGHPGDCRGQERLSDQALAPTFAPSVPQHSPASVTSGVSLATLKERLHYDPETGVFTWLSCPGRPDLVGRPAGTAHPKNGVLIRLDGRVYRGARLAWFYVTGAWPDDLVDHRDGDPTNNRWLNLRAADWSINQQNQRRANSRNLWTPLLGVSFHRRSGKYEANITVTEGGRKRKKYLGLFPTDTEAHAAYVEAKRALHPGNTL